MEDSLKPENTGKAIVNVENRPSSGIRKYAKENNYDLILMGNRGRHQSEFLRGSVAEKLIRASKVPVLTLNKADNSDFRHIVMPTDASLTSMAALPMALLVAAQRKASLTLLSVEDYEAKNINREGGGEKTVDTYLKNGIIKNLKKFIKTQTPNISFEINPEDGDSVIQIKSDEGKLVKVQLEAIKKNSAHQGIVDYASKNADLVVMGTHGRSGLMKVFLGSTAEKVLRRLDLPILTVRPKNIKKNKKDKKQ